MLRVAAVDQEALAREYLRARLEERDDLELVAVVGNGRDALDLIESRKIDLLFLDIRMRSRQGPGIETSAAERGVLVIFTIPDDGGEALDMDADDHLPKPFDAARLDQTLERAFARNTPLSGSTPNRLSGTNTRSTKETRLRKFVVKHRDRMIIVDPNEVDWIEASGNYVKLHTKSGHYHLRTTMKALEKALDPNLFLRIHRSSIVRIDAVRELHRASHGDMKIVLRNDKQLTLSRHYRERFERVLGNTP